MNPNSLSFHISFPSLSIIPDWRIGNAPPNEYKPSLPTQFHVFNNYPNPFNPYTTLNYELVIDQHINISIFDMLGRKIKTLVNEQQSRWKKSINWQATNNQGRPIAGGVYICSIKAGESVKSIKMVYLK